MTKEKRGFVHIYTGEGKGKTTAAVGLTIRALGRGMKVLFVQFLKGGGEPSGELITLERFSPDVEILRFDQRHPIFFKRGDSPDDLKKSCKEALDLVRDKIKRGNYDLVVLDEINNIVSQNWLDIKELLNLIREKPEGLELILTGRDAQKEAIDLANYVTEMRLIKHPFKDSGIYARKGIEY